jgi:hypothetical protein
MLHEFKQVDLPSERQCTVSADSERGPVPGGPAGAPSARCYTPPAARLVRAVPFRGSSTGRAVGC